MTSSQVNKLSRQIPRSFVVEMLAENWQQGGVLRTVSAQCMPEMLKKVPFFVLFSRLKGNNAILDFFWWGLQYLEFFFIKVDFSLSILSKRYSWSLESLNLSLIHSLVIALFILYLCTMLGPPWTSTDHSGHAHPRGKKGKTDCGLVKRCHFYTLDFRIGRLGLLWIAKKRLSLQYYYTTYILL